MSKYENKFVRAAKEVENITYTENGCVAQKSTLNHLVDLFAVIGAIRNRSDDEIIELFDKAYNQDKLLALKCLFYAADIREGLGERKVFKIILNHLAFYDPEVLKLNINLIPEYSRWDYLYALDRTPLENDMWKIMKDQTLADLENARENKPVSLIGKWLKSLSASNSESRRLARKTAKAFGLSYKDYRHVLVLLRKQINIVENHLRESSYEDIDYSKIPSKAMHIYSDAFYINDLDHYSKYLNAVSKGEAKINSAVMYPYDLVKPYIKNDYRTDDTSIELQWKNLPNYVSDGNILVVADVSGSMSCNNYIPISTSVGLAIYFAERNNGEFHNMLMTFSSEPQFVTISENSSLYSKVREVLNGDWGSNTDIEAALTKIIDTATSHHVPKKDMPKSLIIISDMEFDSCTTGTDFYDTMKIKYEEAGYNIPNVVFWNVNSHQNTFHAAFDTKGVQLASGASTAVFKSLVSGEKITPEEYMLSVLNTERYSNINIK